MLSGRITRGEDERQVLQLCGSPTEVWRIATEPGSALCIGYDFAEDAAFHPITTRTLVRMRNRRPTHLI
jgi:hypothetical protein